MTARHQAALNALLCFALLAGTTPAVSQTARSGEVRFNHPGGFYQSAFTLSLTMTPEKTTIYYTTNGDDPQPANASLYVRPIEINTTTTIVRAAAFDAQTNPAGTGVRTFLFIPDILKQTGAKFPTTWGANNGKPVPAYYGMSTASMNNAATCRKVATGLESIPTLSIVANEGDFFSPETGIYTHPLERGVAWERQVSLEMFNANGQLAFQCDCGLRIHGGTSRQPEESPKHSFRVLFKKRYGSSRLHFPIFGDGGAQEISSLILRAGNNDSWLASQGEERMQASYLRDEWMRRSMRAMGHPSARGLFVHLYLNGLYWGVYNLCEKPGPDLITKDATDANGKFDVIKGGKTEAGDKAAWKKMMSLANAGVSDDRSYQEISRYVDLPELADYMILNYYAGNSDWDRSANWVAIRPRTPDGRFQFLVWDGECTLGNLDADTLDFDDDESPPRLFHKLSENKLFRLLFATRAHELLFNNGPLAPKKAAERYHALAVSVAQAMEAEAARWGNYRRDVQSYKTGPYEAYCVVKHWQPETNRILTRYFPLRREILLNQFRERGLFADHLSEP
jgi:hypothetical protein